MRLYIFILQSCWLTNHSNNNNVFFKLDSVFFVDCSTRTRMFVWFWFFL